MNWDMIEGKWNEYRGKAQAQWGKLTDDDLDVINGRRKELAGRIQVRYGIEKEEAERQIEDWSSRH
ncbi:CsbD family protein [Pararhizobium sp. BT-229]|uniref:CsbD family protein n=1 Tax=Pararhizobium sp. BT-229 TaxID=2986923 RepID=UPI0021F79F71|nr:CsbD family protein [Pararhizobium sp. BT-229]MCV9962916.1 CsbD family protein [Pararhizobium sp. BT-229]